MSWKVSGFRVWLPFSGFYDAWLRTSKKRLKLSLNARHRRYLSVLSKPFNYSQATQCTF